MLQNVYCNICSINELQRKQTHLYSLQTTKVEFANEYMKDHIFELRRKI